MSAHQTTVSSGIADLLHGADIDEFVFEPCGYSMNGLQVSLHLHRCRHSTAMISLLLQRCSASHHIMPLQCKQRTTYSPTPAGNCQRPVQVQHGDVLHSHPCMETAVNAELSGLLL